MCQQTRVEAVIPYWLAWMEAFPTVQALAEATEEQVNARWAGLGFYRRARMLHNGSKQVLGEFRGELPRTLEELRSLRGVGPYTAGARRLHLLRGAGAHRGRQRPARARPAVRRRCAPAAAGLLRRGQVGVAAGREARQGGRRRPRGGAEPGDHGAGRDAVRAERHRGGPARPPGAVLQVHQIGADALQARRDGALEALLGAAGHGVFSCPRAPPGRGPTWRGCARRAPRRGRRRPGAPAPAAAAAPEGPARGSRLVVLALRREPVPGEQGPAWLLWRRAGAGLLAGQWEFPCALVAQHLGAPPEDRDPGPEARGAAASALLRELGAEEGLSGRESLPGPLEHVFSHVRRSEEEKRALVPEGAALAASGAGAEFRRGERRLCWMMGVGHMADVGVTAAVRKVLGEVASRLGPEAASAETPPGRKRRRAAVAGGARPKRSAPGGVRGAGEGKGERQQQLSFTKPLRACADAGGCIDVDSGDAAE
ncbi:unnamed protein product [Prorocentrum cordatum]|uniref:Adenine DNA glycosylase n=1 Tax=Prorocentrum cordatum TaxID=2364126 RepID=A0ABN9P7J0_9DINO|nr:unnamed protein product [Polarella glacialis]